MLLTKEVKIKMNPRTRGIYRKLGYNVDCDEIILPIEELPKGSCISVDVQCDYCGKIFQQPYADYLKGNKYVPKVACWDCHGKKTEDVMLYKYGVKNTSQLEETKRKKCKTCKEHFGCEHPMQSDKVMRKAKISMVENYGVPHNFQREEIKNIVRLANSHVRFENGTVPASKAQKYLCSLYNGILNYPVGYYNLDILLENDIYIEYNGSGHDMNLRKGQITKEEYQRKEIARYCYIKKYGYKEIIFDNISDKLPSDEILLDIKRGCVEYFELNPKAHWIRVNLDTGKITTKNAEIFYVMN